MKVDRVEEGGEDSCVKAETASGCLKVDGERLNGSLRQPKG